MNRPAPLLIAIVGPTAVGKTDLAIEVAKELNTVILSADSRQFYKEMTIGTAKPTNTELSKVPHYFINSHGVEDNLSAGDYEREALQLLNDLYKTHSCIVLVGGSGLFVDALTKGLDELPKALPGIREELNARFESEGIAPLQALLKQVDPEYFEQVDIHNPQRIIRALEVWKSTNQPFSHYRKSQYVKRPFKTIRIGLHMDRAVLYDRINSRVDRMMEMRLLEEVRGLAGFRDLPALKTVGYAEIFDYLDGRIDLPTAVDKIKQNSRRYAKRQLTWFKKNEETKWFEPNQLPEILDYIKSQIQRSL